MTEEVKTEAVAEPVADKAAKKTPGKKGFDSSLPFATVHGGNTAARFCQDGVYYDGDYKACEL